MSELARVLLEQANAARYLTDDSLCAEYAAVHHCTAEHAREGAKLAIYDWVGEEIMCRLEDAA